mmetsp:Transcript_39934/g.99934  ORF Transcript_39934/g.99934 Transcript_39934/m.99934 type:complete len:231 (-) Transcript_39934:2401-3093(-)
MQSTSHALQLDHSPSQSVASVVPSSSVSCFLSHLLASHCLSSVKPSSCRQPSPSPSFSTKTSNLRRCTQLSSHLDHSLKVPSQLSRLHWPSPCWQGRDSLPSSLAGQSAPLPRAGDVIVKVRVVRQDGSHSSHSDHLPSQSTSVSHSSPVHSSSSLASSVYGQLLAVAAGDVILYRRSRLQSLVHLLHSSHSPVHVAPLLHSPSSQTIISTSPSSNGHALPSPSALSSTS